jgi:RNA polymerase sigma-70 factor (ECF subfamily)
MTPEKQRNRAINTELTQAHHDFDKGLLARAFFKTHSQTMGADLVQDTFIKTWGYLQKGGKIDIMKAFLYHVLNCLIIDQYRKHKTLSLDTLIEKGFEPTDKESAKIFNILDGKAALLLIEHLPEKYKKIMRLRFVKDLSIKDISLIMKQTSNTTTVQVHRGLLKLKTLYNH